MNMTLSEREVEVLQHVAGGYANAQIGRKLYLTENTVKSHLRRISKKIGQGKRAGMVSWAIREGLIR